MMKLDVLMNGELAGTLSYTAQTHRYAFRYSPAWLSRKAPYALGPTLPLEVDEAMTEERHSALVRQFFENLLPEGQALDDAASTHKLSKGNLMGLLAALGGETAGALQLRLPGTDGVPAADTRRALSHAELSERIRARPFHPFSVWDGRVRLSIAGFQDKIAVFEEGGQWALVEGGSSPRPTSSSPSRSPRSLRDSPATNTSACGLPTGQSCLSPRSHSCTFPSRCWS